MKIQKVTLKDIEFVKVDGEYEQRFVNEQEYPAFLTNYALKKGKEEGLIESSIISDLLKFQALEGIDKGNSSDLSAFEKIDQTSIQRIIYLAFKGANPKTDLSFDEFLRKYHDSLAESMELYAKLVVDVISQDPNKFAAEFQKNTSTGSKGEKK
ncbi:hypothetical protein H9I32_11855 [Bacillus sp. Xin]|uniref:hypothetical protein n=1 Tax=unclassified Bacillus (in: firmicutes) TaxID=185979 RepID=UPI0015740380|nr:MULTISPECIES: hypothetical protein [unclassified Bacillus (in: firmicutes)]MBC6973045.1 hypothetical protein [Bacillus sp. Xin]NSW37692.1 hypothetical protein [Bacillus sp. Xin1]